jgi:8-oxo-dGTP diphosphatase
MATLRFVLGFCFDFGYHNVLLIEKSRPTWQAGKLNGIGGKIEEGESPRVAMAREFQEETGGMVASPTFIPFGRLIVNGLSEENAEVWLFHAKIDEFPVGLYHKEIDGEILHVLDREDVNRWPTVPNVRVLLPMALNHARHLDAVQFFEIRALDQPPEEV